MFSPLSWRRLEGRADPSSYASAGILTNGGYECIAVQVWPTTQGQLWHRRAVGEWSDSATASLSYLPLKLQNSERRQWVGCRHTALLKAAIDYHQLLNGS